MTTFCSCFLRLEFDRYSDITKFRRSNEDSTYDEELTELIFPFNPPYGYMQMYSEDSGLRYDNFGNKSNPLHDVYMKHNTTAELPKLLIWDGFANEGISGRLPRVDGTKSLNRVTSLR